jgi:NAD(P)-dependent dehydrogenase (short-subunit alcohol dehydrogenase family)
MEGVLAHPLNLAELMRLYDLTGRTIVVTGAMGVIGSEISRALVGCGATVVMLDRDLERAAALLALMGPEASDRAVAFFGDVLDPDGLRRAADLVAERFGPPYALINSAGGNTPEAATGPERSFFDVPLDALRGVVDLNLLGTVLPSQIFGRAMATRGEGVILNVSSMSGVRPLTRVPGYSAAKAAVSNFTQWLAVHMAQEYAADIRVNAIAPGFLRTRQNEFLLTDRDTGELTPRGRAILAHTPMGRFGTPADLFGAVLWLLSPASAFVTGVVVPVDGGFSAYGGV